MEPEPAALGNKLLYAIDVPETIYISPPGPGPEASIYNGSLKLQVNSRENHTLWANIFLSRDPRRLAAALSVRGRVVMRPVAF